MTKAKISKKTQVSDFNWHLPRLRKIVNKFSFLNHTWIVLNLTAEKAGRRVFSLPWKPCFKGLYQVWCSLRLNTSTYRNKWQLLFISVFQIPSQSYHSVRVQSRKICYSYNCKTCRKTQCSGQHAYIKCKPSALCMYCSGLMYSQILNWKGKHMYNSAHKQTKRSVM